MDHKKLNFFKNLSLKNFRNNIYSSINTYFVYKYISQKNVYQKNVYQKNVYQKNTLFKYIFLRKKSHKLNLLIF